MKLTDSELIELIWINQLRNLSRNIVRNYVGGAHGLGSDGIDWRKTACRQHKMTRDRITTVIGRQQLLKRIRNLVERKLLQSDQGERAGEFLTFWIGGDLMTTTCDAARSFWLKAGMPEGFEPGKGMRSVKGLDVDGLAADCFEMLLERFPVPPLELSPNAKIRAL